MWTYTMVYDSNNEAIILFGGITNEGVTNETWKGTVEPVPEPSSLVMFLLFGLGSYGLFRFGKKN